VTSSRTGFSAPSGPSVWRYLATNWHRIEPLIWQQIEVVLVSMLTAGVLGVGIGVLVWNKPRWAGAAQSIASIILTIPSLAMLVLFIPFFGLGWLPSVVALVLYAQLPILRNTITGLRGVDSAILESAKGIGMSATRRLIRVQLPLAWPVVMTGLRVSTVLTFGISAIAAYVNGPGLGNLVFTGLSRIGSANSENQVLVGGIGIALLALVFDAAFLLLRRVTISGGLRV